MLTEKHPGAALLEACIDRAQLRSLDSHWHWKSISCTEEIGPILRFMGSLMAPHFPRKDIFGVRVALYEAMINALKHGNGSDLSKRVRVQLHVNQLHAMAVVEDQGLGFNAEGVIAELDDRDYEDTGRGLILMRATMTWIRFNEKGNSVMLCKFRSSE